MNQHEVHDKILEEVFIYAAEQAEMEMLEELPSDDEIAHIFSGDFEAKMQGMIKRQRQLEGYSTFKRISRRAAVFFICILIAMSLVTVSVEAFRIGFLNLYIDIKEKFTSIRVEETDSGISGENSVTVWEDIYLPEFVPEGFEWVETEGARGNYVTTYQNDKGESFFINQTRIGGNVEVDTENADYKEIIINGNKAFAVEKDGEAIIAWHNEEFIFRFIGYIEQKTAIEIAESCREHRS